jgi:hypothetical protein
MDLFIVKRRGYLAVKLNCDKGNIGLISAVRRKDNGQNICYFSINNKGMNSNLKPVFLQHQLRQVQQSGPAKGVGTGTGYVGYIEFGDKKSVIDWLENSGFTIQHVPQNTGKGQRGKPVNYINKNIKSKKTSTAKQSFLDSDSAAVQLAVKIIEMFGKIDFRNPRRNWPKVILADDPPEEEKCRFDGFPERIDGLLGLYCDSAQSIVLFCNPIATTANSSGVPFSVAIAVVLAHELAHWVTYRFDHPKSKFNNNAFKRYGLGQVDFEGKSVTEVVEGIAELATFCAIKKIEDDGLRSKMLKYFKEMHKRLCSDYRAFDIYFEFWPLEEVVSNLVRLARRNDPSASTLKSNKDHLSFEYHWHGVFESGNPKASPWMLSNSVGPAVLISINDWSVDYINCWKYVKQIEHDDSGWYNWPSNAISNVPVYKLGGRPSGMRLRQIYSEFGRIKPIRNDDPAMVYRRDDYHAGFGRFSCWEPNGEYGVWRSSLIM